MAKKKRPSIGALKERFKKEKSENTNSSYSGDMYPFWSMNDDERAVVRILPDANDDNDNLFFVDKLNHVISLNGENKTIACPSMHGEECPICELSQKFYKEGNKEKGKYYYRKKSSMVRVLVISDPLPPDEETHENREGKVMNTQFGWQLMEKIKHSIVNDFDDDDAYPWDLEEGINFVIAKTKSGDYSKYDLGSGFERKASSVEELIEEFEELDDIDDIELVDLSTLLPKCKDYGEIENMLHAHLNGEDYEEGDSNDRDEDDDEDEDEKPAKKSKKKKDKKDKKSKKKKDKKSKKKKRQEEDDEDYDDDEDEDVDNSDEDEDEDEDEDDEEVDAILKNIKNRKKNK